MLTKIKIVKKIKDRYDKNQRKKLNKGMTKKQGCFEKIEQRYNKNQVWLEKIEVRYDKNQGYQEKLNKGMTKIKIVKKN